jgi:dTMP kinase
MQHHYKGSVNMKNFITIEGCDGVGKTYQTKLLREFCQQNGYDHIVFTREPGGSDIAEQIRKIILDAKNSSMDDLCEAFLYASSRIQHLKDIVKPALEEGKVVFCDRFVHSSYVYQGLGRGLGLERIISLNELAVGEYMPEFTIFLDLSPEKAFERKGGADQTDRMEAVDYSFHQKVYEGYRALIEKDPDKFIVIDASGTIEQTQQALRKVLFDKGILQ